MSETIDVAKQSSLDALDLKIGTTADTGGSETEGSVMGKLNTIANSCAALASEASVIKSIQIGSSVSVSSNYTSVTISEVDVNKCMVIANGKGLSGGTSSAGYRHPYAYLESSTSLRVGGGDVASGMSVRWQVIEFY